MHTQSLTGGRRRADFQCSHEVNVFFPKMARENNNLRTQAKKKMPRE
jgi:hypothetical protein